MNYHLRQSTASQSRSIGPFVDETDFKTAETALTINNTDIKLLVNGGASANKNSGGGTHRANGFYGVTFDATDTATVGELMVSVVVAGALPVFQVYTVLEEAVFDALYVAAAAGYQVPIWSSAGATVNLSATTIKTATDVETDTADIQGRLPAALVSGRIDASVGAMAANVLTAAAIASDAITDAKVASDVTIASVTGAVGSVTGNVGGNVVGSIGSLAAQAKADVNAEADTALADYAPAQPGDAMDLVADAIVAGSIGASANTEIAAAVLAAATAAPIASDVKRINAVTINGAGVSGNEFEP